MKAIGTFLRSMAFLAVCIVAWTVLPVLFLIGLGLFLYALAVESLSRSPRSLPESSSPTPPSEDTYEATPRGPASCAKRPA